MLDEGAPSAVAQPFLHHGHDIIMHHDVLSPGAKDQLVAYTAIQNDAILLAVDRDMKGFTKRFGSPEHDGRFKKLNLILVCCNEPMAAKRISHAMSFIEHEYDVSIQKQARKLWVEIGAHRLVTHR